MPIGSHCGREAAPRSSMPCPWTIHHRAKRLLCAAGCSSAKRRSHLNISCGSTKRPHFVARFAASTCDELPHGRFWRPSRATACRQRFGGETARMLTLVPSSTESIRTCRTKAHEPLPTHLRNQRGRRPRRVIENTSRKIRIKTASASCTCGLWSHLSTI